MNFTNDTDRKLFCSLNTTNFPFVIQKVKLTTEEVPYFSCKLRDGEIFP